MTPLGHAASSQSQCCFTPNTAESPRTVLYLRCRFDILAAPVYVPHHTQRADDKEPPTNYQRPFLFHPLQVAATRRQTIHHQSRFDFVARDFSKQARTPLTCNTREPAVPPSNDRPSEGCLNVVVLVLLPHPTVTTSCTGRLCPVHA